MPTKQTEQGGFVWVEEVEVKGAASPRDLVAYWEKQRIAVLNELARVNNAYDAAVSSALLSLIRGTAWCADVSHIGTPASSFELCLTFSDDDVSDLALLVRDVKSRFKYQPLTLRDGIVAWTDDEADLYVSARDMDDEGVVTYCAKHTRLTQFIADYDLRVDWSALKGTAILWAEDYARLWTERLAVMRALVGEDGVVANDSTGKE